MQTDYSSCTELVLLANLAWGHKGTWCIRTKQKTCATAGQFDAQDGPGSVEAWTTNLDWPGRFDFFSAKRHIWRVGHKLFGLLESVNIQPLAVLPEYSPLAPVAGYVKHHHYLTSVVLKDAGHMVPRDKPLVAQAMMQHWVQHSLQLMDQAGVLTET